MKEDEKFEVIDERGDFNPDESTAIPNDLVDKYIKIFNEEQLEAVFDLIGQSYRAGLEIGRKEKR